MHTDTHTRDDFRSPAPGAAPSLPQTFGKPKILGDQEGPQPNLSPTKLAELPSGAQGHPRVKELFLVPRDGPRAQPVVPGFFFSDVGKVQIEPCPFPLLQSIPHLCTCSSPQNLVWGITVPPKKAVPKPNVGQDPPSSLICCIRSSGTGWAASLFTMQKTASSIKENKTNGQKSWVILSPLPLSQWKYKEGRKP